MEELENEISTQVEENTVSLASAQALADALAKIEVYTPTTWVDNSSPDIDAEHLNKPEQAIKRVTDALNSAVDVIKDLQSQVTKNAGDISTVNNNLSKRLLIGNDIASADLLNDNPAERFGTLSMRFSDGSINQLLLLKDTAVVTILRNNAWTEQYRFATTSMLSNYVPKSDLVVSSSDIQSKQNITDSSNIKFYKYGKIVVAHIQITTTSNLSGYDTLKVGVIPNGFKPLYECRSTVLMQQANVSRILSFTPYGDINLWNWSSNSSITTPSGSALNGFAVYCVA